MRATEQSQSDALASAIAHVRALLTGAAIQEPDATEQHAEPTAIDRIVAAFRLSAFERDILVLCAAVELDPAFPSLCATLNANPAAAYPTFGLALVHLSDAHWSAFAPQAPLRRWRLVEAGDGPILTATPLRIDERVLHFLLGISHLDSRLATMIEPLDPLDTEALAPSHGEVGRRMIQLWTAPRDATPVVQLCGSSTDCRPIVAAAANGIGVRAAVLDSALVPRGAAESEAFVRLWEREIALGGYGVLLIEREEDETWRNDEPLTQSVGRLVDQLCGPVVVRARDPGNVGHRPSAIIDVGHPTPQEQQQVWRASLGDDAAALDTDAIVAQFNLSVPVIRDIATQLAARLAASPPTLQAREIGEALWHECRIHLRARLDGLAQRIDSRVEWNDLVLPDDELETLRAVAAQLRRRMIVYERWGFASKSVRGLGISALFTGPSGAGKTTAAEVLASALQLDLYRIDLSSVVSKYIGETEKNLRRVFDAAEESGAILLFDEADALFGKRSEVRDSLDRYANMEVGYLLQRMEAYRGLAILTTNTKSALDPAFLRRIRFVVNFPFPDASQREEIWLRAFPKSTPTAGLDFTGLASLQITGGNIRNIAMNAAFLAADADEPVGMSHVLSAARTEYAKLERHLTIAETRGLQ